MEDLQKQLQQASDFIRGQTSLAPKIGIILGTGMGALIDRLDGAVAIPYARIPGFPCGGESTDRERLALGRLAQKPVLILSKRFHYYEGYTSHQISFPIRLMKQLGVQIMIVCNAAGGLNPLLKAADLMVIVDHINLLGTSPLIGPNPDWLGVRFPDMKDAYDPKLVSLAEQVALEERIPLRKGVYVAVHGPNLETPAETRFLRAIGADAVGMSTVPEVIVGVHAGLRILGFSIITNINLPDAFQSISFEEVVAVAARSEATLRYLIEKIIARIEIFPSDSAD